MMAPRFGLAIVAVPRDAAEDIARRIVESRLAACAQVTSEVTSIYWWKGRMEQASERLVILKTEKSRVGRIRDQLRTMHPYEVPELVFLPITAGNPDYLEWLADVIFKKI
jgi:periplasmic divalent cation tolerance protein